MLLWINGAFGSGKTQTAFELHRRLPHSFVFDPEHTGFFLRNNQPGHLNLPNFQDEPLWRQFNRELLLHIGGNFGGVVLVPMTLIRPDYYHEIITPLRQAGLRVDHYVLAAGRETIHRRLRSRLDGSGWAAAQTDACLQGLRDPVFEHQIDTERLTVPEVAEHIAAASGLPLAARSGPVARQLQRASTLLRHIRRK